MSSRSARSRLALGFVALAVTTAGFAQEPPLGDPMRPYRAERSQAQGGSQPRRFLLSAVLISNTRRIAVINGGLYREGDEVGGALITRIESGSVRLRRGGVDLVVSLTADDESASDKQGDPAS